MANFSSSWSHLLPFSRPGTRRGTKRELWTKTMQKLWVPSCCSMEERAGEESWPSLRRRRSPVAKADPKFLVLSRYFRNYLSSNFVKTRKKQIDIVWEIKRCINYATDFARLKVSVVLWIILLFCIAIFSFNDRTCLFSAV